MDWPGITMYRGLVSARPHKQEMIEDLRRTAANGGMIMCIDRASEGQISHALLYEMDTIRKACASLEEGYLPPLTFVAVQIRDHTRLFPEVHGRHDITEKIGAHDCVEQDRNGVSTTGSTRQTSGVLEGQIKGKFKEEDIFFTPLDGVLKIRKVVTMRKGLDAEGYQRDLKAIIPILDKHFRFKDAAGLPCFPMLVDDLITEIRMLNSEKTPDYFEDLNRRSIIFNHPATLCSSMRINIYTSILLHSSSLSGANYQNFRDALDPPNSYKFHPPNWVLRAYDRHDQSSPTGLGTVFNFPGKKYRNTFFSRLDFSRCLLTHGLINEITEKQVEAALYLLWPHQLPELHRKVMLLFKPTIRSTSANSVSPAVNTVNTIDILELFGSRK